MNGLFFVGAVGYPLMELLYRGRTHYSMAVAGGIAAALIGRIHRLSCSRIRKALLCGLGITITEAICGAIWNRRHKIWDYRNMPLNWKGQICLPYTALWCLLSGGMLAALDKYSSKKRGRT